MENNPPSILAGTAGWGLSGPFSQEFPGAGTHLERYARRLPAVEINTSFYRPHQPKTYARWAASTPEHFRFAVKVPREITHTRRLQDPLEPLERFLSEAGSLGEKLGPLLVQLPPSLPFEAGRAGGFFDALRARFSGSVVCEPRHVTWFQPAAQALLERFQVARAAADPALNAAAAVPGGWPGLVYYRLHGSPRMYYSDYSRAFLQELAGKLKAAAREAQAVWCIFDNTAEGAALGNALSLLSLYRQV